MRRGPGHHGCVGGRRGLQLYLSRSDHVHTARTHQPLRLLNCTWVSNIFISQEVVPSVDVAVIEVGFAENEHLPALGGMAFRDPSWQDDVYVFGYPYVPGLTERPITVARGQMVTPSTEAAAVAGYPRQPTFLTSEIARPGDSGGPIVAQDGRVIGLVAENAREVLSTAGGVDAESPDSPPFYRGIPAGEVLRAIEYLGFSWRVPVTESTGFNHGEHATRAHASLPPPTGRTTRSLRSTHTPHPPPAWARLRVRSAAARLWVWLPP